MKFLKRLAVPLVVGLFLMLTSAAMAATTKVYVGGSDASGVAGWVFAPADVTIHPGDSILFTMPTDANQDPHSVNFKPGNPAAIQDCWVNGNSRQPQAPNAQLLPDCTRTFTVPGDYHYNCAIFDAMDDGVTGHMHAVIHVVAKAAPTPTFTTTGKAKNRGKKGITVSLTASSAGSVTGTITSMHKHKSKVQKLKAFSVVAGLQTVKIKVASGTPPKGPVTIKAMLMTADGKMVSLVIHAS